MLTSRSSVEELEALVADIVLGANRVTVIGEHATPHLCTINSQAC